MPRASIGRMVIVHNLHANGALDHAAMITRAWSERPTEDGPVAVNLIAFPDASPPEVLISVMLFDTEEHARRHVFQNRRSVVAYWPERTMPA